MILGLPKEIKNNEFRVGLTPGAVGEYVNAGNTVYVEQGAGLGAGFADAEYAENGAILLESADEVWARAEMIVKVKEPLESEYKYFREGLLIYTYFHLAAAWELTEALLKNKTAAMAYETILGPGGKGLPCLYCMSEIAGRMSVLEGAKYLEKTYGGRGVMLGAVAGCDKADVVIIGAGNAGINACRMAVGMGARVTVLDIDHQRLVYLDEVFASQITTLYSSRANLLLALKKADLVIGCVMLAPGRECQKLVRRDDLRLMKKGAVLVDIVIDQGGCFETSHPTTHDDPVFEVDGIMHYCVANIPGSVPRTSTEALVNATLRYGLQIAKLGLAEACKADPCLMSGLNTYDGKLTFKAVAEALDIPFTDPAEALGIKFL